MDYHIYSCFLLVSHKMSLEEVDTEALGAEPSGIVLKTDEVKCKVCGVGTVTPVKNDKASDKFMLYTQDGTLVATHIESLQ